MKKKYFILFFFLVILFTGCKKQSEDSVIKDLSKKVNDMNSYQITGVLNITNNDDTYTYDVKASFKKDDNFRVSLLNKSNNHEQIILKNSTGVYVVTPSLNKSFKFQSDWPHNNSQIYLLQSLLKDIKNDEERKFEAGDDYVFTTKADYPNNVNLVKQKMMLDKDLNFKKVEVLNNTDIPQMIMEFKNIDTSPVFADNFFDLNSIIKEIDSGSETTEESGSIDDIIYPLYIPLGTVLTNQEKVAKDNGERIILTFDGEKPFLLVEETSSIEDEFSIVPIFGEPYLLSDTIGALSKNSISWSSNGIDYYIVSDVMSQIELIEIANSITAIPTIK